MEARVQLAHGGAVAHHPLDDLADGGPRHTGEFVDVPLVGRPEEMWPAWCVTMTIFLERQAAGENSDSPTVSTPR